MKALLVAHTVITTKEQAIDLTKRLNKYFEHDKSIEMAFVVDDYISQLVEKGFLTWEEVEQIEK